MKWMGHQKLYANKTVEYLAADDIYYRIFLIQDIWDNLLKDRMKKNYAGCSNEFYFSVAKYRGAEWTENNLNLLWVKSLNIRWSIWE